MLNIPLKWIPLFLFSMGRISFGLSQNIVPNPSFETYSSCPSGFGSGGPLQCTPWQSGSLGTSDYFNVCSTDWEVLVPTNYFGTQAAHTGNAYAGGYYRYNLFLYREYLQVPLTEPMVAGYIYDISFYVSLADNTCGINHIGIYFSASPPPGGTNGPINVTPQFESNLGFVGDKLNWTLISGCYAAQGGEQWITIGNFYNDANTPMDPNCDFNSLASYYYVDGVSITQGNLANTLDLDLGDPVTACVSYEINPGLTGFDFHWSDGSTDPTLTVTQSGTYALTITSGCEQGIDSVEVTFIGVPDVVDLGPPEVTICNGDSYDISLDPNLGTYEWQDGSTNPDYSITTPGVYQVTFNDGCDVNSDQITVFVLDPPAPFSLGGDASLCPGDEISFSFDPALGDFHWQDNSTSSDYTIDIGGIYALTISNMCGESSDDIEVTEIQSPAIDLGPDQLQLCAGQIINIAFDPGLGDYLWQDGSTSPFYSISGPGTYAVTLTNQCGSASDTVEADLIGAPVFDLGQNIVVCPAQLPITLNVGNATNANSFLWQDGSTNSQYQVNSAGTFSVTVSNSCFSIADSVSVIVQNANPVVALPPDQMLCQDQTLTLSGNGLPGSYLWQDLSTADTLFVNAPGAYSLTITNQCGSGADTVQVDYMPDLLPPDLGSDIGLCPGETYVFHAGVAGVNYTWQDMSSADSLLVTTPGTYSLQIANMCSAAADTVIVSLNNNPPVVDLPASIDLCSADTVVLDAGISGVEFLWNDGSQASTLKVFNPGLYSLTVSNACGSDADTVVIKDAGPAPMVSLGQDISLCSGDVNLITPVSSDVLSWLWQDGSSSPTYAVSGPGVITVQAGNNCGVRYDTLIAALLPAIPVLQLGSDTSLCPGSPLSLSINIPGVTILWSDGSASPAFNVIGPGLIYATISNACGSSSDSLDITFLPPIPTLDLGADQSLCPGDVISLSPGISGVTYLWQDGSTASTFNAIQEGTIILTISNACGFATDTLNITENTNGPHVDLGPDITACAGSLVTLSAGIAGVNYLWQDGSTNADLSTNVSGTYILRVSNSCGVDIDSVDVNISGTAPEPYLGKDTLLCEGESIVLSANSDSLSTNTWQDGSDFPTYTVTSPGSYILSASNHCGTASDTIIVSYQSAPKDFDLGKDTILCPGESIVLTAPQNNLNITWQDGSHGPSMIADQALLYSLQLSNDCGSKTDSLLVDIDERTPAINIDSTIRWCEGDVITLDASQSFNAKYLWNDGSSTSAIQVDIPGLYSVRVTTDCQSINQNIEVIPADDCNNDIYIPNIFSPNGDQVNDFFTMSIGSNLEVVSVSCSIFDRWGNMVFNTTSSPVIWDGHFGGELMMPGVYVYQIYLNYISSGEERKQIFSGDITLIR